MLLMLTWSSFFAKAQFRPQNTNLHWYLEKLTFSTKRCLPWKLQKAYYELTTSLLAPREVRLAKLRKSSDENPAEPIRRGIKISIKCRPRIPLLYKSPAYHTSAMWGILLTPVGNQCLAQGGAQEHSTASNNQATAPPTKHRKSVEKMIHKTKKIGVT